MIEALKETHDPKSQARAERKAQLDAVSYLLKQHTARLDIMEAKHIHLEREIKHLTELLNWAAQNQGGADE